MDQSSVRPGASIKTLSRDSISGAISSVISYPDGWQHDGHQVLTCDEELFILDGHLRINGADYSVGDYAYLPAGYTRESLDSHRSCVVLTFFESAPEIALGQSHRNNFEEQHLIEHVRSSDMDWGDAIDPKVARGGVGRKPLRPETATGDRSWLMKIDGTQSRPFELHGVEAHPCVEEMFQLSGDFAMTVGTMQAGAYFWRPPMIKHGPMGTRCGWTAFLRAKEGWFSTQWSKPDVPIPWDAPYKPVLPHGLSKRPMTEAELAERW